MRPPAQQVLFGMFLRLSELGAAEGESYRGGELRVLGAFCALLAVDSERAVSVRLAELRELRDLLTRAEQALPAGPTAALAAALAAGGEPADPAELTPAVLEARVAALQRGLIDLQSWLEENSHDSATTALLDECWEVLRAGVQRKAVPLPM